MMETEAKRKLVTTCGLKVEKHAFTWKVDNFDVIRTSDKFINSQKFEFQTGSRIGLKMHWNAYMVLAKKKKAGDSEERDWISVYLRLTKKPADTQEVNGMIQVNIKKNSTEYYCKCGNLDSTGMRDFAKSGWGFPCIIQKDKKPEDLPLIDGSLVMEIDFHLYTFTPPPPMILTNTNGVFEIDTVFQQSFTDNLQSNLKKLLEESSRMLSDVQTKIISKDNVEFDVNKAILSVRSPVFERMLRADMKEAKTGIIRISELTSKAISVLLQFIYTGTLAEDWSSPKVIGQLVYAADKYQLMDLRHFLDNAVGKVCTEEIAGKLLNLVRKLGMKTAEKEIFEILKEDFTSFENIMALVATHSSSDILDMLN